jgi:hypothetical protein|tara:strand:+ start:297 stop:647 length:351 start_codon:yes stop_codon:yes gene_type:complete
MENYIEYNQFDPNVLMKRVEEVGNQWAEADAVCGILEDTRKTLLAKLIVQHLPEQKSISKAEQYAMCDEEYSQHMKELGKSRKDKNLSLVKYNTLKKWIDLIQTKEANLRAEMKIR